MRTRRYVGKSRQENSWRDALFLSSNVCLDVAPSLAEHSLPRLLEEGLYTTLNSDDPPLFNTTLTDEYLKVVHTMNLGLDVLEQLVQNGIGASGLPEAQRKKMSLEFRQESERLRKGTTVHDEAQFRRSNSR